MKLDIGGVETIQAPVEVLWKALNDPVVLTRCIPGCKTMTEIAPDAYKVEMQLRVAAVGGSFEGEISLSDKDAAEHLQHQGVRRRHARPWQWQRAVRDRAGRSRRVAADVPGQRRDRRTGGRRRAADSQQRLETSGRAVLFALRKEFEDAGQGAA